MKEAIQTLSLSGFREGLSFVIRHASLIWEMSKREFTDRYAGQFFGSFWAFGHSLILMLVYVFVFTFVFKIKLGGSYEMPLDYTTYLLSGLIPWMAVQEAMSKSTTVLAANANVVKQVVFPIEVLPIKGVVASMITQGIATGFLLIYILIAHHSVPKVYVLFPFYWLMQFLTVSGLCMILAAFGPYFKDIKDFVQVFSVIGMYMMPVTYLPQWVPDMVRPVLYANPFSHLCWCHQDMCYFGRFEHPISWAVLAGLSVPMFAGGFGIFRKLKVMFGNVL
jgi:lipopolysaccharide transport system permease protein